MISPTEAAAEIAHRGVPVVYIDTSSILDLIRGQRDAFGGDQARAAVALITLAESSGLTFALSQQVMTEYASNVEAVREGGERSVDQISKKVGQVFATMEAYGVPVPSMQQMMSGAGYVAAADVVIDRLLAVAVVSLTTPDATNRAMQRVVEGRAPAASAKQSAKDCLVLETTYETLRLARDCGFEAPAYFLSANTAEYEDGQKRSLHFDLIPEFTALNMTFAKNYLELRHDQTISALF